MKRYFILIFALGIQDAFAYKVIRDDKTGGYRLKCAQFNGPPTGLYSNYEDANKAGINCPYGIDSIGPAGAIQTDVKKSAH